MREILPGKWILYIVRSLSRLIISGLRSFLFAELIYQGELILTTIFIQNNHIMTDALATTTIAQNELSGVERHTHTMRSVQDGLHTAAWHKWRIFSFFTPSLALSIDNLQKEFLIFMISLLLQYI